ncbi:MAG: hypothetical protein IJD71_00035 [Clostridia bacterium]|nr:hypothetical protein [Clostridia bacterium]
MKIVKKQILRVLALVMALCLIAVCFSGCGKEAVKNPYKSYGENILESRVLASNDNFELAWDSNAKAVLYKTKDGKYWSDIYYEGYLDGSVGTNGMSPISITVFNNKTLEWSTITSGSVMDLYLDDGSKAGNIYCGAIDNGIRVYYFFEQYKIAVPIDYVLRDDHIEISVNSADILEDGKDYRLISVGFMTNFGAVKNDKSANIFVPTGTGAIINCAEDVDGIKEYTGTIYGDDITNRVPMDKIDNTALRMPVFGSYDAEKGLLGIIDSAMGSATLTVNASNDRTGYSTVSPEFYVRGYDTFRKVYYGQNMGVTSTKRPNDDISNQTFKVLYYPLFGDEANYNGMAKKYQSYLVAKGLLTKTNTVSSPYSITLLGGTNTTKSFFGIPYKKISPLTTFTEAKSILEKLNKDIGVLPQVRLLAYGDSGLRPGTIAGGSKYPSEYGSKKDLLSLVDYCKNTNLFLDFDIITYSKSGNGFSLSGDVAKTAIGYKAERFPTTPTRVQDKKNPYYALGRDSLAKAAEKALKKADKYSANAVSLSTLGMYAYSDYKDNTYINRNLIEAEAKAILDNAKKQGYVTAVADANAYAAAAADVVFDVPLTSGEYDVFSYDIPFYQMVFSSYKPLYSNPVNSEANLDRAIAKSVAYGMGLGYYITNGYVDDSDDLGEYKLYQTVFDDNDEKIKKTLIDDNFISIYNKVNGAALVNYKLTKGLAKSVFSNGVVIYTNLSNNVVKSPVGNLQPFEYKIG